MPSAAKREVAETIPKSEAKGAPAGGQRRRSAGSVRKGNTLYLRSARACAALAALCVVFAGRQASAVESVTRAVLPNGLRIVVVRDTLAPVVTTELNYLVGSNESPPDFPGMAHAQEHMMFRGSSQLSAAQLAAITAQMGGDYNADNTGGDRPNAPLTSVQTVGFSRQQFLTGLAKLENKERA